MNKCIIIFLLGILGIKAYCSNLTLEESNTLKLNTNNGQYSTHSFYKDVFKELYKQTKSFHDLLNFDSEGASEDYRKNTASLMQAQYKYLNNLLKLDINVAQESLNFQTNLTNTLTKYRYFLNSIEHLNKDSCEVSFFSSCKKILRDSQDKFKEFYDQMLLFRFYPDGNESILEQNKSTVIVFPTEILLHILSYVDAGTVYKNLPACSRFFYILAHDEKLWKELYKKSADQAQIPSKYILYRQAFKHLNDGDTNHLDIQEYLMDKGDEAFNSFSSPKNQKSKIAYGVNARNLYENALGLKSPLQTPLSNHERKLAQMRIESIKCGFKELCDVRNDSKLHIADLIILHQQLDKPFQSLITLLKAQSYFEYADSSMAALVIFMNIIDQSLISISKINFHPQAQTFYTQSFYEKVINFKNDVSDLKEHMDKIQTFSYPLAKLSTLNIDSAKSKVFHKEFFDDLNDLLNNYNPATNANIGERYYALLFPKFHDLKNSLIQMRYTLAQAEFLNHLSKHVTR